MSRTDKTRPYWVVAMQEGVEEHDHTRGYCLMEDPRPHVRAPRRWHRCPRRVVVIEYCTKQEPHKNFYGVKTCWKFSWNIEYVPSKVGNYPVPTINGYTWKQCEGHKRIEYDHSIECYHCDSPKPWCRKTAYHIYKWPRYKNNWDSSTKKTEKRKAIQEGLLEYYEMNGESNAC